MLKIIANILVAGFPLFPACVWAQSPPPSSSAPNVPTETSSASTSSEATIQPPVTTQPAPAADVHRACQHPYYPAIPVTMGFKGVTTISFHVEPDGSVKDVVVTKSSGFDALDQVAAECATQWQYKPAMRNGQPIEVSWHANVQWNLASRAGR